MKFIGLAVILVYSGFTFASVDYCTPSGKCISVGTVNHGSVWTTKSGKILSCPYNGTPPVVKCGGTKYYEEGHPKLTKKRSKKKKRKDALPNLYDIEYPKGKYEVYRTRKGKPPRRKGGFYIQ